ncbi:Leukocyte-associated immunoglobulin-like receptor 1 [Camelus dromedarius]|uniref:Leukocyte-associated immunoglobulin-like receptor 1 n=1 Tax=Camelus dromedarius TaxID=9838 RepID=A0A5N4DPY9_CAMDR|nr:Leukocyte-associated immunoglobulin-like receptor 1 [Camelus dromedarius]
MSLHPTGLLGLGTLPRPSISAEPDSVIPRGRPVTIVCRGPAGFKTFRLENEEDTNDFKDTRASSPLGPHQTEARFLIPAVSEGTATHYRCRYIKEHVWSEPSESLELVVTGDTQTRSQDGSNSGLLAEHVYILIGVSVAFLLLLLLLVLLLLHRQHQRKRGAPSSKGEEPRPQERLSPTADILDGTPDLATTPAAGGPQEVTYAQLDHRILTERAARAVSLQSAEPTAESSTYAAIARH